MTEKFLIVIPDAKPFKTMSVWSENRHYYAYRGNDIVEVDLRSVLGGEDLCNALTILIKKAVKERSKEKMKPKLEKHELIICPNCGIHFHRIVGSARKYCHNCEKLCK